MAKGIKQIERENELRDGFLNRPLPSNTYGESALLGSILLDNKLMAEAAESLQPDDFYSPFHRAVFIGMLALFEIGSKIDPILIGEELKKEGKLESYGGVAAIANVTHGIPHFNNLEKYIKLIKDKALARNLIKTCNLVVSEALAEEETAEVVLDRAEQAIFAVRNEKAAESYTMIDAAAGDVLHKVNEFSKRENKDALLGLTTGFRDLDAMLAGWQKKDLILVAARPSAGKTAFSLNSALRTCQADKDAVVGFFSLEMSKEQLALRIVASEAMVDSNRLRNGFMSRQEWERVAETYTNLQGLNLLIDDTPGITTMQLRAKARRMRLDKKRLDLIVVDYLQLMTGGQKRIESRQQEVSAISRELKALAKELDVPLIALSQLSRASETRSDHKPQLSDLRESGSLEQDADVVAFIFREEMYRATDENFNQADIIIGKNRNGATGAVKMTFIKELTRFEDLYRDDFASFGQIQTNYKKREKEFYTPSEIKPEWSDIEAAQF